MNPAEKARALESELKAWAKRMRAAIVSPRAEMEAFLATERLAPLLAQCDPGARFRVGPLVVWYQGENVRFEVQAGPENRSRP